MYKKISELFRQQNQRYINDINLYVLLCEIFLFYIVTVCIIEYSPLEWYLVGVQIAIVLMITGYEDMMYFLSSSINIILSIYLVYYVHVEYIIYKPIDLIIIESILLYVSITIFLKVAMFSIVDLCRFFIIKQKKDIFNTEIVAINDFNIVNIYIALAFSALFFLIVLMELL